MERKLHDVTKTFTKDYPTRIDKREWIKNFHRQMQRNILWDFYYEKREKEEKGRLKFYAQGPGRMITEVMQGTE